ncbi:MAG: PQQ-binding-like beta-propeller repeat protein, partial [Thermoanaerobaculia bacterium]|nr:PQQ-binding-like beta-propeller repeat protein [Thermoanaerobaculia bacterium]
MSRWTRSVVCLVLGGSLVAGAALGGDWTQFRGPQGSGSVQEGLPEGAGLIGLRSGWVRDLGSGYSGVVTDGKVLVTQFAAGEKDVVGAFDATSGDELWRFELEPTYKGHDGSHNGPIATPLIAGDRVFASGAWGRFVALDLATGELAWSVHFVDDLGAEKPWYGFGCSPIAVGDDVVVGVGIDAERGTLVSFTRDSGEVSWRSGTDTIEY